MQTWKIGQSHALKCCKSKTDKGEMDNLLTIVIHRGNQKYLKDVICCAENNKNKIILIGDKTNSEYENWINYEELNSPYFNDFKTHYVHMSSNPLKFELICFERYFLLYEFMKKKEINSCIMMDSDVLLYKKINCQMFEDIDIACTIPNQKYEYSWVASPHYSFWTQKSLLDFIGFCISMYKENIHVLKRKWNWNRENNIPGGICDMSLLYLYIQQTHFRVLNLSLLQDGAWDDSLSSSQIGDMCYKMSSCWKIKRILKVKDDLYFESVDEVMMPVNIIHAQGDKKKFISALSHNRIDFISFEWGNIKYWVKRIYEKCWRILGIEKRFNW